MGLFDSIFGGGTDTSALQRGQRQAKNQLLKAETGGVNAFKKGQENYTPEYRTAGAGFDPFLQQGTAANAMYGNALGLNGQGGYDAAVGAYHHNPGWDFALNEANQNVLRNQAQTGALNSGGTLQALSDRAQGLQNQEFQTWLDNLYRGGTQGLQGATGKAGALMALGNQFADTARGIADVKTGARSAMATNAYNTGLGMQNQTNADQASQLSLLNSILGAGGKIAGSYFG